MISVWELETFYRKRDIIIIGAGFTGLWTAISIKEKYPEKSVLIIERNSVPLGASTRNAGFACFGSLTEVLADAEKMGWEKTLNLVKMRYDGLQKIQSYFKSSEIDFELNGGFEILNNDEPLQRIDEVNEKLEAITGIERTYFLNQDKIKEFGLGTEVENMVENVTEVEIKLTEELSVKSNQLIHCTNAFASRFLKEEEIIPARGQIIVTEPIENLKLKGTFHYDEGFYYFRNLGNRILLGGGRNQDIKTEETTAFETTEFLQNHLENFLKEVIVPNQNVRVSMRWSGIMAMGSEKTPIIKQVSERQFCAVRLSGMGVALAPKIGEVITEMI